MVRRVLLSVAAGALTAAAVVAAAFAVAALGEGSSLVAPLALSVIVLGAGMLGARHDGAWRRYRDHLLGDVRTPFLALTRTGRWGVALGTGGWAAVHLFGTVSDTGWPALSGGEFVLHWAAGAAPVWVGWAMWRALSPGRTTPRWVTTALVVAGVMGGVGGAAQFGTSAAREMALLLTCLLLAQVLVRLLASVPDRVRPPRRGGQGPTPVPGEVWWADVPFVDEAGTKDRPVIIDTVTRTGVVVFYVTTKDKDAKPHHFVRIPDGGWDTHHRQSWAEFSRKRRLTHSALRRRGGRVSPSTLTMLRSRHRDSAGTIV
jgi:hypothetical protein